MQNTSPDSSGLSVPVRYFLRVPNVGDRVNPGLVAKVTNRAAVYCADPTAPHILAIGSVLTQATGASRVWGTGLMKPDGDISRLDPRNVKALRGVLTRDIVAQKHGGLGDIPLGDPGILVPQMLGIDRNPDPQYSLGLVPHYVDRWHPFVLEVTKRSDVLFLDVTDDEEDFLRDMAKCATVASSSLHGLIFAEAMGIPNTWLSFSDKIAGGTFKYRDWFTTTQNPRENPMKITDQRTVEDLISASELAESTIDRAALAAALDAQAVTECVQPAPDTKSKSVSACRQAPLPCFLISYNRAEMLRKCVAALKRQTIAVDIVIHDNGSDAPATCAVLDELEAQGITVHRKAKISSADALDEVDQTIQAYFADWAEPQPYLVSDCDIDLSVARADALEIYLEMLTFFRRADAVGPMLRIRDIPKSYPLRNQALNCHIKQFWKNTPEFVASSRGALAVQRAGSDTTLAIHRADAPFKRKKSSVRVYAPFEARHLEWYPDATADDDDTASVSRATSQSPPSLSATTAPETLKKGSFVDVQCDTLGRPELRRVTLKRETAVCKRYRDLQFRLRHARLSPPVVGPSRKTREFSAIFIVGTGRSGTHFLTRTLAGFEAIWDPRGQQEDPALLRPIAQAALLGDPWPESARTTYGLELAALPRGRIFLDQHHPNLFFAKDIIAEFGPQYFIFPQRPTEQIVASMFKHSGVLMWFDVARKHAKTSGIAFPNRFLGLETADDLDALPLHVLCAHRVFAHNRAAQLMAETFPDMFFILPYEQLVQDQLAALSSCLGHSIVERLGHFSMTEKPNPKSLLKYQSVLTKAQIAEIRALEKRYAPAF